MAAERGIRAQAAIPLGYNGGQAGLNLYSRGRDAFEPSTVQLAELFTDHAAILLGYAGQVETLGQAIHSRQDIGTAVGILMERYRLDQDRAFAFLVRVSSHRNIKVRVLAQQVIAGTFQAATDEEPPPPRLKAAGASHTRTTSPLGETWNAAGAPCSSRAEPSPRSAAPEPSS